MTDWSTWVGRQEIRGDQVDGAALTRWLATFDRKATADGSAPQAYHWCLCLPDAPTILLGSDGHPLRDESPASFLPPVPLPRRMWAASKVEFVRALRPGQAINRVSRIASITEKKGGSGLLVFVDVEHQTMADGSLAIRETQSIVYREAAPIDAPLVPPTMSAERFDPDGWEQHSVVVPSEALLFRFSALTFNSHRIHYDLPYAREHERYRGLVVHGPLTASMLLDLAQRHFGDNAIWHFDFRGTSPAIAGEVLHLAMRGTRDRLELGAFADDGRQVMTANAQIAPQP